MEKSDQPEQRWVVRIIEPLDKKHPAHFGPGVLESFCRAGLVRDITHYHYRWSKKAKEHSKVYDIYAPEDGSESDKSWAQALAEDLRFYEYYAAATLEWTKWSRPSGVPHDPDHQPPNLRSSQ